MSRLLLSSSLIALAACSNGEPAMPSRDGGAGGLPVGGAFTAGAASGSISGGGSASGSAPPTDTPKGDGGLGASPSGGAGATAGSGGEPMGENGGEPTEIGCSRALLKTTLDAYFAAMAAHDASTLRLATGVRHTENGVASELGVSGLWKTAGARKYAHSALDVDLCSAATQAVVPEGPTDVPVALRLSLEEGKIAESELIVARAGDYPAVPANPTALAASDAQVGWERAVPSEQRASREGLTSWIDKYFRRFPAGVCNTTADCLRIENGGGNYRCGQGASCAAGEGSGPAVLLPRLILADVETGLGVGFTLFTGGYLDMHVFKMSGGEVRAVSAILANGDDSGWDSALQSGGVKTLTPTPSGGAR